jgi:lipopolysaccharide biosynthesis glycosyltransferase
MKILIPEKFKKEQELISSLDLEILHKDDSESNFSKNIPLDHISAFEFTEIKNSAYHKCDTVQYRVKFKNGTTEIFKFNHKQNALYRSKLNASAQHCVRHKLSELFEDTDEGRLDCLEELDNKILEASGLSKQSRGTKNLVYYTIYFNKGYIELLDKSITSIINKSKTTFDVLLITDEPTRELILQQPFVSKIAPKFLITETPFDGIEASQNKARVFEYEHIHEYDKVLFLDCDIVCLQDINKILNQDLDTNTLYTARNLNLNHSFHTSFHHGFEFLDQDHVEEMKIAKQWPFNAGQFLFRTSDRMQKHFENINWFMKHWAGEYFFEQAFMCYYFCKAYLTDDSILQQHMSIVSTINESQYNITNDTCLVHFIAPPLDAATKLSFINNFMKQHQLQSEQNNRFHIKISKLFAGLIKQFKQRFV